VRVWSLIAAVIVGSCAATAVAQEAAGQSTGRAPIAVIDIGYILEKHPTMKSEIEAIERGMEAANGPITQKRDAILKKMEELQDKYTEGSPEYEREEKSIAEQDTSLRLEIVKLRKKFDKARASVLYNVYMEVKTYVSQAAEAWGTLAVLHVKGSRKKLDPGNSENVGLMMSQEVLHFDPRIDLTQWVLDRITETRAAQATSANRR